eukprot:2737072-Lingulodinium_polyedra.AAC.1
MIVHLDARLRTVGAQPNSLGYDSGCLRSGRAGSRELSTAAGAGHRLAIQLPPRSRPLVAPPLR